MNKTKNQLDHHLMKQEAYSVVWMLKHSKEVTVEHFVNSMPSIELWSLRSLASEAAEALSASAAEH